MNMIFHLSIVTVITAAFLGSATQASAKRSKIGGFDVSNATIPVNRILSGGVGRDQIPSIDNPKFLSTGQVHFLRDLDLVVSVTSGETTRAYPLRILNLHEIVNDSIAGEHIAVTYCPLCGTAMVFDRKFGDEVKTFGVSGLLYNSDVLMYDRESESLWSQLAVESVAGTMVGTPLNWRASAVMKWKAWKERYPAGEVLSTDTGFRRDYNRNPYAEYMQSTNTMFPVPTLRRDLPKKTWVMGLLVDGKAKAYQLAYLPQDEVLSDTVNGRDILIHLDGESMEFQAEYADTREKIPAVMVYWFAWQGFYPDTEVLGKLRDRKKNT